MRPSCAPPRCRCLRFANEGWSNSREGSLQEDDPFTTTYREAEELIRAARSDQIAEPLRLRACQVAYAERYHECLPLEELIARIAEAGKDEAAMAVVVEGTRHLVKVLVRLRVHAPKATPTRTVEDLGSRVCWGPLNATTEIETTR